MCQLENRTNLNRTSGTWTGVCRTGIEAMQLKKMPMTVKSWREHLHSATHLYCEYLDCYSE